MITLADIDAIEKCLGYCKHEHVSGPDHYRLWCHTCGAVRIGATWQLPHLRDLLLHLAFVAERLSVERVCTVCSLQGRPQPPLATHVATARNGMQWFECGNHDHLQHALALGEDSTGFRRSLVLLEDWLKQIEESHD
jgi:hypothetical protein